jgi:predicted ATPase
MVVNFSKTHKSVQTSKAFKRYDDLFRNNFLPMYYLINRIINRKAKDRSANIDIKVKKRSLEIVNFYFKFARVKGVEDDSRTSLSTDDIIIEEKEEKEIIYFPVKEMLSNAPGFRSLFKKREVHFPEIYLDVIDKAFLPPLKEPLPDELQEILRIIEEVIGGKVKQENELFFIKDKHGEIEFDLVADGFRKFSLLWLLIKNGTLSKDSILFWDEPEANINPSLMKKLVDILLRLQRHGMQIFIATHDYVILKEFDLQTKEKDSVQYISLFRSEGEDRILHKTFTDFVSVEPNPVSDAQVDIYDAEVKRALGGFNL